MRRLSSIGLGTLAAGALLLMAPLLMVMAVMGGSQQQPLTGGCSGDVVLAAGTSEAGMSAGQQTNGRAGARCAGAGNPHRPHGRPSGVGVQELRQRRPRR